MNLRNIEENVKPLGNKLTYDKDFIFDLLAAYGRSQGNITRLRNGQLNVADDKDNEVAQKGVVYFKPAAVSDDELYTVVDDLKSSVTVVRYSTRFVIATNYKKLLAIDTKTGEPLDINIKEIAKHHTYFLPWAGMEKAQFVAENHADVKAAEKMAKLFDTLVAYNGYKTADEWHYLTTFFTRLLFCFFAEDTNIFQKNQFINAIASYTQEDGSDLKEFLRVLFASLDDEDKTGYPAYLAAFPYVNGQLFSDFTKIPEFNKEARKLLVESSSKLDWSNINPDIFGSMFQAVVRPGERTSLGQHYTSVPNILKTIEPLFLDDLKAEFDKAYNDIKKLEQLLGRISKIKVFDPACGSGNFLIIAYKELRKLEHAILERKGELVGGAQQVMFGSSIHVENFYGIEIDDFAHEVAILSLWLAKHQMNMEFAEKFGIELPLIPLKEAGNIVQGNAARLDWNEVCYNDKKSEIYLAGNPPYAGFKMQTSSQKEDMKEVFSYRNDYKKLDYISCWFHKATDYIRSSQSEYAFVATNSISQGEHVGLLWPEILSDDIEIGFAHLSFKWTNNAKHNAGVTCVVVGVRNKSSKPRRIIGDGLAHLATNINAYLVDGPDIIVHKRSRPISNLPKMSLGNMPKDDGNFLLTKPEVDTLIKSDSRIKNFIRPAVGAREFLNGIDKWCIWITPGEYEVANSIELLRARIDKVRDFRQKSTDKSAQLMARTPYMFREQKVAKSYSIIIPTVTSERREYIPMGILDQKSVIIAPNNAIYDPEMYVFGLITSRMHMVWVRAVAGRLKTDFRYSSAIAYNNFPVPVLTQSEKDIIKTRVHEILDIRENHPEKTLANMYDPDKMPDDLRLAHQMLDEAVEKIYRKKPFDNDEERLTSLFDLYEAMTVHKKEKII
jgi:hypothetical protein